MKTIKSIKLFFILAFITCLCSYSSCKYGFKDVAPIPAEVKTFRVVTFQNKAQYVNPQLSPQLTEKVKQKIINTTRLRQVNAEDAHYDISGYFTQYYSTTVAITDNNAAGNRLNVGFHLSFKDNIDPKKSLEVDLVRTYGYSAQLSLNQFEANKTNDIIADLTDDIFNKIFSNW